MLSSCSAPTQALRVADAATTQFYSRMAAEKYEEIHREASDAFKANLDARGWATQLGRVRKAAADCTAPSRKGTNLLANFNGVFVTLVDQRVCNKSLLDEVLVWRISNDKAVLQSYRASGTALLGH